MSGRLNYELITGDSIVWFAVGGSAKKQKGARMNFGVNQDRKHQQV
jgi:hypothetical protein